jgi:hypothetical protein
MATFLKQSTAIDVSVGPFVDAGDGVTPETTLTITQPDIRLKKNGGAWAQKNAAQTLSHEENGWYEISLDATDTNTLGNLLIAVNESGALPVWREFQVMPANVWDSLFGADKLQVHADEITAGLITAAAIATGAIDADALATDAVTEIVSGVWDALLDDHAVPDSFGEYIGELPLADNTADTVWDTLTSAHQVAGSFGEAVSAIDAKTTNLPSDPADASDIAALFDAVPESVWEYAVDGATTAEESMRLQNAALAGKASGMATTTATFRDLADSKNRIVATVDADGNRTAVTLDAS